MRYTGSHPITEVTTVPTHSVVVPSYAKNKLLGLSTYPFPNCLSIREIDKENAGIQQRIYGFVIFFSINVMKASADMQPSSEFPSVPADESDIRTENIFQGTQAVRCVTS